jgi:uncharacterized membrane protein (DUF373 family)
MTEAAGPDPAAERRAAARAGLHHRYRAFNATWQTLSVYERFEQIVALILGGLISIIVVVATWDLAKAVLLLAWEGSLTALDYRMFQEIFSQIMILLIALEFKHSIVKVVAYRESIIQVQTVVLVAILAIARKFIILDTAHYDAPTIFALAAVTGMLALTYWLIWDRDARRRKR